jgi:WXG100 family type VII secretion target
MSQIRMSYDEMRAVASDFQAQSDAVSQILSTLNSRANQLMSTWEGVAEQSFMQELQSCQQRMSRVPEMLAQISQALNNTAAKIEEAEQAAASAIPSTITADNA